jgi:hypothetical protein
MMAKQNEARAVTVGFDPGTSSGKVNATWQSDEFPFEQVERYYLVPSAMQTLNEGNYANMLELSEGHVCGVNSCLLSYIDPGNGKRRFWEMGSTATRPGQIQAQERKFEKCLAKVLAFLGYLVRGELRSADPIELTLGLLLPLDEFGDRRVLAEWLRAAVGSFEYNGARVENIKLAKIVIKPEGYGLYKASSEDSALVVNWGHSDLTMLVFNDGWLVRKQSSTWPLAGMHGFMKCLDFPYTYELEAAQIISAAGRKMNTQILAELTQTASNAEMASLKKAIALARDDFWEERSVEFGSVSLNGLKTVLVGGGTTRFFDIELNRFYKKRLGGMMPNWGEAVATEFTERFDVDPDSYLPVLFKDIYGYYCTLPGVERFDSKPVEVVQAV